MGQTGTFRSPGRGVLSVGSIASIAAAAAAAFAPIPAGVVERLYSNGAYPVWQSLATRLSNRVPFALFDAALALFIAWLVWSVVRDLGRRRRGWALALTRMAISTATAAAVVYLLFLAAWGFNYRRVPLSEKLPFDGRLVTPARARELALAVSENLNALHDAAHAQPPDSAAIDRDLARAFGEAAPLVGARALTAVGRPKRSALDAYFKAAAVDGMTDPFFLETLVVSDLLPFERPFVVAHEWSHLAGFADESEASFVGWLACVHGDAASQYSGWLFLWSEMSASLSPVDRAEVMARLGRGPRDDLRAIAGRIDRDVKPIVFAGAWRTYDRYLKANRVEAGVASYGQVVRLVLGTRFGAAWRPLR